MTNRNIYLTNTPVDEAREIYLQALKDLVQPQGESIPVIEALGRVTAEAVYARFSSPQFNAAAMDGIAVIAKHTATASELEPLRLHKGQDFMVIDTGDPIRPPYDAVIMAEDISEISDTEVEINASAAPWQHVRPVGEDIVAREMILPRAHVIRPSDIGVLLSSGITQVQVTRQPQVALIPTGTEIIEPDQQPRDGQIIESNSRMFAAMVQENGGIGCRLDIVDDDYQLLKQKIREAVASHDMVIVNAGSSAGTEDYTVHILRELGQVLIHGVAIKPGKPVILAIVAGKPVIGLPGYPVSAYLGFETFVTPVLSLFTGLPPKTREKAQAILSKRLVSSLKYREYVRVKVGQVDERLVCTPLARGAGAAMSLVRADGFCIIGQHSEGLEASDTVELELYRPLSELGRTVVSIGSHDLILDVIADIMPTLHAGMFLSSTHVGSMAGLMALKRGEAHLAPTHLLDEESGEYNIAYLRRLFAGEKMALIKGVQRIQGFIVPPGNPLNIQTVADLPGKRYINRQRGAGTRVLLDYQLKQAGIEAAAIEGYEREAATHMAVSAAVADGSADTGMGILSAARALELDFVKVGVEEYDFAIHQRHLELPHVQAFLQVLTSQTFADRLSQMGGYGLSRSGEVILL